MQCLSSGPPSFWLILFGFLKDFCVKCLQEFAYLFLVGLIVIGPIGWYYRNFWFTLFLFGVEIVSYHVYANRHRKGSWFARGIWAYVGLVIAGAAAFCVLCTTPYFPATSFCTMVFAPQVISYGIHRLRHRYRVDQYWDVPWSTLDCLSLILTGYMITGFLLFEPTFY